MRTRNILIIVAILAVIAILVGYLIYSAKKDAKTNADPTPTVQTTPQPCTDTAALRADLESKEEAVKNAGNDVNQAIADRDAAQKALRSAIRKCQPHFQNGDTIYVKIISDDGRAKSNRSYRKPNKPSQTVVDGSTTATGEYVPAPKPEVRTSVIEGKTPKAEFCVNVRNMDDASFWPHLAINAGMQIEGAILNGSGKGYNISIDPVDEVSGLYGVTRDGRMFVKASLLDKFSPATIKMSGTPNGWTSWEVATLQGDYYITEGNK